MHEVSILQYINKVVVDFKYNCGIITGLTTGVHMKIDLPISIEYSDGGIFKRYDKGDYLDIKANESIDIIILEEADLKAFERELYSAIPDNQLNVAANTDGHFVSSLFNRIKSMENIKIDKQLHLMAINSKDGLSEKNAKYVPELWTYSELADARILLDMRLELLKKAAEFNNRELKYMVIVHIKYPVLSLKMFSMNDRKVLCGAIQYRRYLHYNEYDKMITALHYDFPAKLIPLMERYALSMAERGLIL